MASVRTGAVRTQPRERGRQGRKDVFAMSFTVPSVFSREDVAGLDIGDSCIAGARVRFKRNGQIQVTNAGWVEYESGASDKGVASAVRRLWRKCNISTFTVCSCLRSRSLAFIHFAYPDLSSDELESALRLRAEETMQMPADEIIMDWHTSRRSGKEANNKNGRGIEGILIATPRKEVERHLAILEMAGVYPIILDVGCMAISNLFLELDGRNRGEKGVCLVNLGKHNADIAVLFNGEYIYPRIVLSRSVAWEEAVDYLLENVRDVLAYCEFKLRRGPVEQLLFTGRIPSKELLLEKTAETIALPAELWNPLQHPRVKVSRSVHSLGSQEDTAPLMTASLGLALRRR